MDNEGQRVYLLLVDQDIKLHQIRLYILVHLIIEGRITSGTRFQRIKEIIDDLIQRQMIPKHRAGLFYIFHPVIDASALLAEIHDRTDEFRRNHDLRFHHRLFHIFNL